MPENRPKHIRADCNARWLVRALMANASAVLAQISGEVTWQGIGACFAASD